MIRIQSLSFSFLMRSNDRALQNYKGPPPQQYAPTAPVLQGYNHPNPAPVQVQYVPQPGPARYFPVSSPSSGKQKPPYLKEALFLFLFPHHRKVSMLALVSTAGRR